MRRLLILASVCVKHDAISNAVVNHAENAVKILGEQNVAVASPFIDRELPCKGIVATDKKQLRSQEFFKQTSHLLLHWGIGHPIFDVGVSRWNRKKTIVCFHNMTPPHLVARENMDLMKYSEHQLEKLVGRRRNIFGTFSEFNRQTLKNLGVGAGKVIDLPFTIENSPISNKQNASSPVRILSVGRMVPAKGFHTIISALSRFVEGTNQQVVLKIASSTTFGDFSYLDSLRELAEKLPAHLSIEINLDIPDEELFSLYKWADFLMLDSNHEGLCVPVIEAMRSGLRLITSDRGNLPYLVTPPDLVISHGSVDSFADALTSRLKNFSDVSAEHTSIIRYFSEESVHEKLQILLSSS